MCLLVCGVCMGTCCLCGDWVVWRLYVLVLCCLCGVLVGVDGKFVYVLVMCVLLHLQCFI